MNQESQTLDKQLYSEIIANHLHYTESRLPMDKKYVFLKKQNF